MSRRGEQSAGYGAVFVGGEFRWLWLADVQSQLGDQLAWVALTVLVYKQTVSGLASAAVYAATFVPSLVGKVLLGPLAVRPTTVWAIGTGIVTLAPRGNRFEI